MGILKDEGGQGAAEYILLFGGVIVVAVAALLLYQSYLTDPGVSPFQASEDLQNVRSSAETMR